MFSISLTALLFKKILLSSTTSVSPYSMACSPCNIPRRKKYWPSHLDIKLQHALLPSFHLDCIRSSVPNDFQEPLLFPRVLPTSYEENPSPYSELRISLRSNDLCIPHCLCAAGKHSFPPEKGPHPER